MFISMQFLSLCLITGWLGTCTNSARRLIFRIQIFTPLCVACFILSITKKVASFLKLNGFQLSVLKPKPKLITLTNYNTRKQNSKQMHVTGAKRGKTLATKSWLPGASFVNQSQSAVKQNQTNYQITFDTQLKTTLLRFQIVNTYTQCR